ncbi:MAG: purine-nucleoside phosphorylase [Bacilli bacterium]|nr:purine-nucleoside phosphorylase [Bacilli bacterium]
MPTVHIESQKEDIAPRVLMPGDPNRTHYIAHKYLENPRLVNKVRGELAYTGTYKGVPVTIFSSGMGIPSMGIYSYELFNDYGVEKIIRIGTAGSYDANLKVYDVLLADSVYSITNFDIESGKEDLEILNTSAELNSVIMNTARIKGVDLKVGRVHSSEAFYTDNNDYSKYTDLGCKAVEMETYALVYNANRFMKKATALFTISDNLITHDLIDSEARERKLDEMITLALESVIKD